MLSERQVVKWLSTVLGKEVTSAGLHEVFSDGLAIQQILQQMDISPPRNTLIKNPTTRVQMISNTFRCLQLLKATGYDVSGISAEDLLDGDTMQITKLVQILHRANPSLVKHAAEQQTTDEPEGSSEEKGDPRKLLRGETFEREDNSRRPAVEMRVSQYLQTLCTMDDTLGDGTVVMTKEDISLLTWASNTLNVDITNYSSFGDGCLLACLVKLLISGRLNSAALQEVNEMSTQERLTFASEKARAELGIEDAPLPRVNPATSRNIGALKHFLLALKQVAHQRGIGGDSEPGSSEEEGPVYSEELISRRAALRSAKWQQEVEEHARNAYPVHPPNDAPRDPEDSQLAEQRSQLRHVPMEDSQPRMYYDSAEDFERTLKEGKGKLQAPAAKARESSGTQSDPLVTPRELTRVPEHVKSRNESLEHHLGYVYQPIPYRSDIKEAEQPQESKEDRQPERPKREPPTQLITDLSSLTVPKPSQNFYDFISREEARKAISPARNKPPPPRYDNSPARTGGSPGRYDTRPPLARAGRPSPSHVAATALPPAAFR